MAKSQTKETYKDVKQDKTNTAQDYSQAQAGSAERSGAIGGALPAQEQQLQGAYQNMPQVGNISIPSSGVIDTGNLDQSRRRYVNFSDEAGGFNAAKPSIMQSIDRLKGIGGSDTGGLTAENIGRIRGSGGFEQLMNNGGLDPEAIGRLRGGGVYDEYAKTGGYNPAQIANIKAQAISPIGSFATGTRDELARRTAAQGGYAPGFDAANRALQRDTARNIADTSLNANVAIQDRVNAGRLAGAGGLTSAEQNLQGLRTGNIFRGASGISGAESDLTRQMVGNQLQANTSAAGLETNLQDRIANYRLAGLSGEQAAARAIADVQGQNIGNQNNVNMFNAGNQLDTARFNAGQQTAGIGGMQNLYNTKVGMYENELDRGQGALNSGTQANLGYLNNQSGLATQPGIGGNIMNAVGTAAGVGSLFMPNSGIMKPRPQVTRV